MNPLHNELKKEFQLERMICSELRSAADVVDLFFLPAVL